MKPQGNPVLDSPVVRMRCACGSDLELSIGMMIRNIRAVCRGCGAKLAVDTTSSTRSVQLLRETVAKLERIRRAIS